MSEFDKVNEITDIQDYVQIQSDKKLTNSPLAGYARTTDYQFNRFKVDYEDQIRDETLKSRLNRIAIMRELEKEKEQFDYTDITRKGDELIYKDKPRPLYSKYQPSNYHNKYYELTDDLDAEQLEIRNMGLDRYLRLLSEGKINDKDVSEQELNTLRSLSKKYKDKIYYEPSQPLNLHYNEDTVIFKL